MAAKIIRSNRFGGFYEEGIDMSKLMYTLNMIVGLALVLFTHYLEILGLGVIRFLSTALGLGIIYTATKCYKKKDD